MDLEMLWSLRPPQSISLLTTAAVTYWLARRLPAHIQYFSKSWQITLAQAYSARCGHVRFRAVETDANPRSTGPQGTLGYTLGWHEARHTQDIAR